MLHMQNLAVSFVLDSTEDTLQHMQLGFFAVTAVLVVAEKNLITRKESLASIHDAQTST